MGDEEGVIVAEVALDPERRKSKRPRCYGKIWAFPMPWFAFIWPETQQLGEQAYIANPRRREQALRKHQTTLDCAFSRSVVLTISLT